MEISIDPDDSEPSATGSGDMVENIERALENPQIRGMLTAVLQNQGLAPEQFGLSADTGNQPEIPEPENPDDPLLTLTSADEIIGFIDEIAAMSPMGEETKLGTIRNHLDQNRDEIESRLRDA